MWPFCTSRVVTRGSLCHRLLSRSLSHQNDNQSSWEDCTTPTFVRNLRTFRILQFFQNKGIEQRIFVFVAIRHSDSAHLTMRHFPFAALRYLTSFRSNFRIPVHSIYMCRCALKNEVYNNSCYSYSVRY